MRSATQEEKDIAEEIYKKSCDIRIKVLNMEQAIYETRWFHVDIAILKSLLQSMKELDNKIGRIEL